MNLSKLFEAQRELDERIVREKGLEGQDLLPMKILAFQVELGELANEWRGFKFWSKHQEPRTESKITCHACRGKGDFFVSVYTMEKEKCAYCEGTGLQEDRNPLLEEYVDGIHFLLSIGNDLEIDFINAEWIGEKGDYSSECTRETFAWLYEQSAYLERDYRKSSAKEHFERLLLMYLALGELEHHLDFRWEQIETAYYAKNLINHERQDSGY